MQMDFGIPIRGPPKEEDQSGPNSKIPVNQQTRQGQDCLRFFYFSWIWLILLRAGRFETNSRSRIRKNAGEVRAMARVHANAITGLNFLAGRIISYFPRWLSLFSLEACDFF